MKKILLFVALLVGSTMVKLAAEPNDGGLKRFQLSTHSKAKTFFSKLNY